MVEKPNDCIIKLKERIDAIIKDRPSHREVLEFVGEVVAEQYRIGPKIKIDAVNVDREKKNGKMEGSPLLDKRDLYLDVTSAARLFKRLCKVLSRNKEASRDSKRICQAVRGEEINLGELFKQIGAENGDYVSTLSKKLGITEDLLFFLAGNSMKPIWQAYADELKGNVDQEAWWKGYCPICGSPPFIAELREEGERFLVCSSCSYEWRFKRLKCPFCENEDPQEFRYFYAEREGKANRVDVCEKCKRYIKTIDIRDLPSDFISSAEDAGTLYLDVLAQEEGYKREKIKYGGWIERHQLK